MNHRAIHLGLRKTPLSSALAVFLFLDICVSPFLHTALVKSFNSLLPCDGCLTFTFYCTDTRKHMAEMEAISIL